MNATPIIHDGDHGSDDFVATLVALGCPDDFSLFGITTCHGNVDVDRVTRNACLATDVAGQSGLAVCRGADRPWKMSPREGDDAFGSNGLGGVELGDPVNVPLPTSAHDWLVDALRSADDAVTLCVTGPMTNIARLLSEAPECRSKIDRIVAMGGCLGPLGPERRQGNITPFAEFNFYMDPDAADFVVQSGVPIVLLPMDVTHQLVFTRERRDMALARWGTALGEKLVQMLAAAERLDRSKFALPGAVVHDTHVFLYLLAPDLYRSERIGVGVVTDRSSDYQGGLQRSKSASEIDVVTDLTNPDTAFEILLESVAVALEAGSGRFRSPGPGAER